jgi:hypothetical protein
MSGKELQRAIIDLANLHRWVCAHFASVLVTRKDGSASWRTPVVAQGKGFPDIFAVRGPDAIAVEVKGDGDRLRDEQTEWLQRLETAGISTFVWTPRSWREGVVEHVLKNGPPL